MNKIRLFAISLLLVFSLPASAGVVDTPDASFGGQTYQTFQDDTTSLYWLDLDNFWDDTSTYNSLIALLDGSGFHLATLEELTALQASIPAIPANFATEVVITGGNNTTRQIMWGIYEDGNPIDGVSYAWKFDIDTDWFSTLNIIAADQIFSNSNSEHNDLGAWIVGGDVIPTYSVGGTVSGLTGTGLELQNAGTDTLAITANGSFTFLTELTLGTSYVVAVSNQPTGQTCTVSDGAGTISDEDVTDVAVNCVDNPEPFYTINGTVSGLGPSSVTLQNNLADDLIVNANGVFVFDTALPDGSTYDVTVLTQPTGQTCDVTNGFGTVSGSDVLGVTVTCADSVYTVGGIVTGLTGTGLALQNNGSETLAIPASGDFVFATGLLSGEDYLVTVSAQPVGQECVVNFGSGTIATADVTDVAVDCADAVVPPPAPAVPVPTLSQWALIMLSMLLGLMVFSNRKRLLK